MEIETSRAAVEHIWGSLELHVFFAISNRKLFEPFFFSDSTVAGTSYLDMMQEWLMSHDEDHNDGFIHQ